MEKERKFKIIKDMGIKMPKDMELKTFQNLFTYVRNSLKIKYTRNIHIDSILKKCKSKFYKAVYDCIRKCVIINIKKIPQIFITNISIIYNRQFLDYTIHELYNCFGLMPYSLETIMQKNYYIKGKENFFKYILLSRVDDLYSLYIQSKRYKKEIESMKKKKGIKITLLYQFVAENLVNYYYYSKPHTKINKLGEAKSMNINYNTNNNKIYNKNFENENENENKAENENENKAENENENEHEKRKGEEIKNKKEKKAKKKKCFYVDTFF